MEGTSIDAVEEDDDELARVTPATREAAVAFAKDRCRRLLARQPDRVDAQRLEREANHLPPDQLLAACMRMEHGDRGEDLTGAHWTLIDVPIADILVPNPRHLHLAESEPDYYPDLDPQQPAGLLRLRSGRYFLLDGYHRLLHLRRQEESVTAKYLVMDGWLKTIEPLQSDAPTDESPGFDCI